MRLLLDTHYALWWQMGDARLTPEIVRLVQQADAVFVSQASLWEITIKAGLGKLKIDLPVFEQQVEQMGFAWLPISNQHILMLSALPSFEDHRDPFDRLLVAQSRCEPLLLLTADSKLARYGATVRCS